jgi:hypothetical protein
MAKGGRRPRRFEAGGILCGHRARAIVVLSPACRRTFSAVVAEACRGLWRAGYIGKRVRPVVCPGKAGVVSRSQSCYGKSQKPYSLGWQGDGKPTL